MKDDEKRKVQDDKKVKHILISGLSSDEFFCIARCKSAKEIWNMLEVTHEGTMGMRRSRNLPKRTSIVIVAKSLDSLIVVIFSSQVLEVHLFIIKHFS